MKWITHFLNMRVGVRVGCWGARATIEKVRSRLNPELRMAGVLLTQVRIYGKHTSVLGREIGEELRKDFPTGDVLDAVIRDDNRFREAPAWRRSLLRRVQPRRVRTCGCPHR